MDNAPNMAFFYRISLRYVTQKRGVIEKITPWKFIKKKKVDKRHIKPC